MQINGVAAGSRRPDFIDHALRFIIRASVVALIVCLALIGVALDLFDSGASEKQKDDVAAQNRAAEQGLPALSTSLGRSSIFELREGDCISDSRSGEVATVSKVSCSSAEARYRVSRVFVVTGSGSYPGLDYFANQYALRCDASAITAITPTKQSWSIGDRTVVCLAPEK
jgi:hypothetical protein